MYKPVLLSILIILSILSTYNVKAAPSVSIIDTYGYLNEDGHYAVVGEIVNNGDVPVHFVELIVTFFDKDREQIRQLSVSSTLEIIRTGQVSPFTAILQDKQDAPLVSSYDVKVGNMAPTTSKEERLSVIFHKLETVEGSIVLSGRIVNDGSSLSTNTRAMLILYDVVNKPVRSVNTFTEPRDILPFASATFSVKIKVDNLLNIIGYAISAESSNYAETKRLVQKQESSLKPVQEVADISNLLTLDANSRIVAAVNVNDPVLVQLNITNKLAESSGYTYILQVTDQNGFVASLSWSMGVLPLKQSTAAVIAWIPDELGMFMLEVFVWRSIEEPVPLVFETLSTNLQVR